MTNRITNEAERNRCMRVDLCDDIVVLDTNSLFPDPTGEDARGVRVRECRPSIRARARRLPRVCRGSTRRAHRELSCAARNRVP